MSADHVEIVRRIYDAYARRDSEAPFELYAPDIEWDLSENVDGLGPADVYRGHDGVRASFRDALAAFREYEFWPEDFRDAGERVLVRVRERAVGRRSDAVVERTHHALWTLHDGQVLRMRVYRDRDDAVRAAGLGG
jgi:ketosteroid isomerase-like protein